MELSPWTVYLVMQADSVVPLTQALSFLFAIAAVFGMIAIFGSFSCADRRKAVSQAIEGVIVVSVSAFLSILLCLVPDTKTAAAVLVLPKIVNSSFAQNALPDEVKEIYALAKIALQQAVKAEKQP